MQRHAPLLVMLLCLCFFAFVESASPALAGSVDPQAPPLRPGMARVWFLRASDSPRGYVQAAAPVIYANGVPVGNLPVNGKFYRDLAPGAYAFSVQSYGLPTSQATTVQLAAGAPTYLQVQWAASWQFGFPESGWGFAPNTFVITPMSPQVAQAYLPTLAYLGAR